MIVRSFPLGMVQANCYVLEKDGQCIVIDPGDVFDWSSFFAKEKVDPIAVLLTHAHFDHINGVDALVDAYAIPVYVQASEVSFLKDPSLNASLSFYERVSVNAKATPIESEGCLQIGPFSIEVYFTPGHSSGSCCFKIEDMLFSGDTLFQGSIGRTDLPTGSMMDMQSSLRKLLTLPEDLIVYPGHGPASRLEIEKQINPYLNSL